MMATAGSLINQGKFFVIALMVVASGRGRVVQGDSLQERTFDVFSLWADHVKKCVHLERKILLGP